MNRDSDTPAIEGRAERSTASRLTPGSAPWAETADHLENLAWLTAATGVLVIAATLAIVGAEGRVIALVVGFGLLVTTLVLLLSVVIREQRAILREQRGLMRQLARRLEGDDVEPGQP